MGLSSVLSSTLGFIKRHRIKIAIAVGGATCLYVYYSFRQKYLTITRALEEERESGATRLQDGFTASLKHAHELLRKMLPEVREVIFKLADSDSLVRELQATPVREHKKNLWERLKVVSFVRPIASVYAICVLELVLVTKFNLVGRYMSSEKSMSELPSGFLTKQTQHKFVELARVSLFGSSMDDLVRVIQQAVVEVVGPIQLDSRLTGADLVLAMINIRKKVESNSKAALREILVESCLSPAAKDSRPEELENLTTLLHEEADILDNDDAGTVLGEILDRAFESFEKLLLANVQDQVPIPKALPKISNLSITVLGSDSPVVSAVEAEAHVAQFGAVVYVSGASGG
mmetsp:Transcript_41948/g.164354  ORF Transcript_41948/g.164354 Transcript_41948/m.164354 type:complete len:346 (-) Transcript_41948:2239-3276(-)|eukprot:CAMPEP_0113954818 /NCGR_PEP_ID=MMETSP0011_2-20120614/860_1 /TAXON_ID=101924 /ORGANISM="Rhodosorus marinus" /LENGTH=345 /DNA_ID=CAMNT_0000964181 /DNA_START=281 /DNA_END=1318 /DNA_ORIENTATION=+ /assembly_acc=CAM_ASM_000156